MKITAATQVFAIIGDPVSHSLSPIMHNGWIEDHGLDAVYVALPLRSDDPAAAIRDLGQFGLRGANVTAPHKIAAARAAQLTIPAANVVRWNAEGAMSAFNTDGLGFVHALSAAAPDWRIRVKRALVIGAGGAGVGISEALSPYVDTIHIANRSAPRAEEAAAAIANARALKWEDLERGFGAADLIVQATTLGMEGQSEPNWPVALCRATAIVADIVYRPLETGLLCAARARGLVTMDGLGMLVHQAVLSFELWFGIEPDVSRARARLMAATAP
jgi:shikimate dehydrogenase